MEYYFADIEMLVSEWNTLYLSRRPTALGAAISQMQQILHVLERAISSDVLVYFPARPLSWCRAHIANAISHKGRVRTPCKLANRAEIRVEWLIIPAARLG
jgi:hypothetical protein